MTLLYDDSQTLTRYCKKIARRQHLTPQPDDANIRLFRLLKTPTAMGFLAPFLDLLYPPQCWLCQTTLPDRHQNLCPGCLEKIVYNIPPFCPKCSRPLENINQNLCHQCRKRLPDFDQAWAATRYNNTMKELLHRFKYKGQTGLRHILAGCLISFIKRNALPINTFDGLIPMPIHPAKHREREFNQTQLLAEMISRQFAIPVLSRQLLRVTHGRAQALLSEKERWTNIQGAFRIRQPQEIKNKSILILDDLITTSATACEAARVCRQKGAVKICILALAIGQ